MFERGYLQLFRWRGTPVRAHFTVVLGALLFTGFTFAPVAWLAFFALILIHELGHAVVVRRLGHRVSGIELTGFGGLCRWSGDATARERAIIAWGGVLAQAGLFLLTLLPVLLFGFPHGALGELASVFLRTNAWLIAINLLPIPPLDGAEAWKLLRSPSRLFESLSRFGRTARAPRGEAPRVVTVHPVPARPRSGSAAPSPARPAAPSPARDLAEALRRIGDDARQARRSG